MKVTMFSSADKVKGQGVGSAYLELIQLLKNYHSESINVRINRYSSTDISHYHTIDPIFYMTTFLKKRFGIRIGYVHFLPSTLKESIHLPKWIESVFYKYVISFYKRMDHLVVVNPAFIQPLVCYGIPKEKITYIPNFVSKEKFYPYPKEKITQLKKKNGFLERGFIVFGAGQVQERKGIVDFIELAKEMPDITFIWAGGFSFGKLTDGYKKYKKMMKAIPDNLQFTGIIEREEMLDYYNMADLFLLPSYEELFPMCILEAFAAGTPVMLRDLELYVPVLKGYYEAALDRKAMKRKITELKVSDSSYAKLKEKAASGNEFYSEEKLAKIWKTFYEAQLKEKNAVNHYNKTR